MFWEGEGLGVPAVLLNPGPAWQVRDGAAPDSSLRHVVLWLRGQRSAQRLRQIVHHRRLLGVHQIEFPYKNHEMRVECVYVSVQVHGHRLLVVGPVDVGQNVEEIPADFLHQRVEGIGELFTCRRADKLHQCPHIYTSVPGAQNQSGVYCSNSQKCIVWVKIIDFFMPKIIRTLRSCSMRIFLP